MTEKFPTEQENDMAAFHAEIEELQRKEESGEIPTGHFMREGFNVGELTERDREIWEKTKSGEITEEELNEYTEEIVESGNKSRMTWIAFISNKAGPIIIGRKIEQQEE